VTLAGVLAAGCAGKRHDSPRGITEALRTTFGPHGVAMATSTEDWVIDAALWDRSERTVLASFRWTPQTKRWHVRSAAGAVIAEGTAENVNPGWGNVALFATWRRAAEPRRATPGFVRPGCDVIGASDGGKLDDRCGTRAAACCNAHDDCYAQHRCSSLSWSDPQASAACRECNARVRQCFMTGVGGRACSASTGYCCAASQPAAPVAASQPAAAAEEGACENSMWLGGADPTASNNGCPTFFYSPAPMPNTY
jgi:hypothetical protein